MLHRSSTNSFAFSSKVHTIIFFFLGPRDVPQKRIKRWCCVVDRLWVCGGVLNSSHAHPVPFQCPSNRWPVVLSLRASIIPHQHHTHHHWKERGGVSTSSNHHHHYWPHKAATSIVARTGGPGRVTWASVGRRSPTASLRSLRIGSFSTSSERLLRVIQGTPGLLIKVNEGRTRADYTNCQSRIPFLLPPGK